jgi:hypothetical protein
MGKDLRSTQRRSVQGRLVDQPLERPISLGLVANTDAALNEVGGGGRLGRDAAWRSGLKPPGAGDRRKASCTNRELASYKGGLHEQEPYPSTGEYGLAEMIDEHDIAIDLVDLRVENPASIGRNRQAPVHGAKVATHIHCPPDLPG